MVTVYRSGCSVRARTELCARKEDFLSGENRTVCAERGLPFELYARKGDFSSGENRTVCAEEGLRFGREPTCVRGRRLFPGR